MNLFKNRPLKEKLILIFFVFLGGLIGGFILEILKVVF